LCGLTNLARRKQARSLDEAAGHVFLKADPAH
jgi:hypothetical protein